jgi:hypothetical protein
MRQDCLKRDLEFEVINQINGINSRDFYLEVGLLVLGVIFFLCIAALLKNNSIAALLKHHTKFEWNVLAIRRFTFVMIIQCTF